MKPMIVTICCLLSKLYFFGGEKFCKLRKTQNKLANEKRDSSCAVMGENITLRKNLHSHFASFISVLVFSQNTHIVVVVVHKNTKVLFSFFFSS